MELRKPWRGLALDWPVRKRSIVGSDQFIPWQTDPAFLSVEGYIITFQANRRQYGQRHAQLKPNPYA
jgi:hypothetical protein